MITDTLSNKALPINGHHIESAGGKLISWLQGSKDNVCKNVQPPDLAQTENLVFISTPEQLQEALKRQVKTAIIHDKCLNSTTSLPKDLLVFQTQNISQAMSAVLPLFDTKKTRFNWEQDIHPTAVIHPTAKVNALVKIGPNAVIGAYASIGSHTVIGANTVIESNAQVGSHCLIHSLVFIGSHCEIGNHCEIHPHTSIGSDGFGFATDNKFQHHKIPQLGKVVIENHVEIGSNCAIDRATLTETRIRAGTKFDNLCHVAHNCDLGSDGLFAAGFFVAGSSKIGSRFMCGGNVAVTSHVKLTDGVILAGRSTVTNDVTEPGQYGGYPLQPLKDALRTIANTAHITEIRKQLQKVLKHLKLTE